MSAVPFDTASAREKALEALRVVLSQVEGVRHVDRQDLQPAMVGEQQLPAIILDEVRARYVWVERATVRLAQITSIVILDLQAIAPRLSRREEPARATTRIAFEEAVLSALADNPMLRCQLPGESEEVDHAQDVLPAGDAGMFADCRALKTPEDGDYTRSQIALRLVLHDTYDGRQRTNWRRLISTIYATDETGAQPPSPGEHTFELDEE